MKRSFQPIPGILRRVNIGEEAELEYWAKKFGVRPDEIRNAVAIVGENLDDLQRELTRMRAA
jgi:hypothetical protein